MLDRLPVYINPSSFAEKRKTLSGTIEIKELTRLSDVLFDKSGVVEITVSFDKEGRLPIISGEIKANLMLECQSCLEQVDWLIDKHFKLAFISTIEQADKLAGDCEPFVLEDDKVSLKELIEDELLLALPDFPRHDHDCVKKDEVSSAMVNNNEQQLNPNNPFSVLAKLKNTGD